MATVYKLEIEVVSDWESLSEEQMRELVRKAIEADTWTPKIRVSEIIVKQVA